MLCDLRQTVKSLFRINVDVRSILEAFLWCTVVSMVPAPGFLRHCARSARGTRTEAEQVSAQPEGVLHAPAALASAQQKVVLQKTEERQPPCWE